MKIFGQIVLVFLTILILIVLSFTVRTCNIAEKHVTNSMENAVISYDEYQDIYNTCKQIDDDLGVMRTTPDTDPQFQNFSKASRVNALKMNLNRWVNEYNAKSKHIDKKFWKSEELPYKLKNTDFSNY